MKKLTYILLALLVACSVECLGAPPTKQAEIIKSQGKRKDGNRPGGKGKATRGGGGPSRDNSPSLAQGIEYYDDGNYDKAFPILLRYAKRGNPEAQYYVGECYYYGWGVVIDQNKAEKWYRKAAEQGNAGGQFVLGSFYYIEDKYTEALKWLRKASEQGHSAAQARFGLFYYLGLGVAQDCAEAVKWYRKAADQGDAHAQCWLGVCYYNGYGVAKDKNEAFKWFSKAPDEDPSKICVHAEQGDAEAQYILGECYYHGDEGFFQDYTEAAKWYRRAADQGYPAANEKVSELEAIGY